MSEEAQAWHKLEEETAAAYAAFCSYYVLLPSQRSIDRAWRSAAKEGQTRDGKRAPGNWAEWSSTHDWVKRAAAHDKHVAELDRLEWIDRRKQLRDADWGDGQAVRKLVMDALPEASRFIERKERFVKGTDGQPDQLIITESFNINGLVSALTGADKLQRLATDEPTEHIQLTGSALDSYIAAQLARLANGGEAGPGDAPEPDAATPDSGAT